MLCILLLFFLCFVFTFFLLRVHVTLCAITLDLINPKNMANFVTVFGVKIMFMIMPSNQASFMNFGGKSG